jgi:hypothetical protein
MFILRIIQPLGMRNTLHTDLPLWKFFQMSFGGLYLKNFTLKTSKGSSFWNSLMYVGTAWCMSEQLRVCRNSLTHIRTAWHISEQPDVCRNCLTYIGKAWCMTKQLHVYQNSMMYDNSCNHAEIIKISKVLFKARII